METARAGLQSDRLVLRIRVFPGRSFLGRRGISRRSREVRRAHSAGRDAAAGWAGVVLGRCHGCRLAHLGARTGAYRGARPRAGVCRMVARACSHGFTLECPRLCADVAAAAHAVGGRFGHLRPDVGVGLRLRRPRCRLGRRERRMRGARPAMGRSMDGGRCHRCVRGPGRGPSRPIRAAPAPECTRPAGSAERATA